MSNLNVPLPQLFWDDFIGVNPEATRLQYQVKTGSATSRKLLAVDAAAMQQRLAGQQARQQFVEFAQAHMHDQVADQLFQRLGNISLVSASIFDLGEQYHQVLDKLAYKAVTINQLDPLISEIDWLKEDLLKLVNQPQYRNRTASGALIKDVKTALRFLGVESLQLIVPVYGMRRCLPHATDPFVGLKTRLWDYTLACAIAARRLAEDSAELPYAAFCVGLFHPLGHIVVTRNYLRTYQQIKQEELLKARDERNTELTDALDGLEPDAGFLSNSLLEFAEILSADISSRWSLHHLPLCQTLDQLAEGIGFNGISPLGRIVQQAQVYVQWQHLKAAGKAGSQEALNWFSAVNLTDEQQNTLAKTNLKRLSIDL
ncbi:HDOD domain-containing protein [Arsukibacterium indicum]|uniref:HDOD domain-containing protein n=1 Tax=Arsukibacterium indicum TaxID=2848612 RepID=A0ABS6MNY9_9GAMM|nr:HDOD domain-containing protein [Arsukibacterium indicum]MBV2130031.1 HDOD domain-containing protein [Arsukibacterium indicum]